MNTLIKFFTTLCITCASLSYADPIAAALLADIQYHHEAQATQTPQSSEPKKDGFFTRWLKAQQDKKNIAYVKEASLTSYEREIYGLNKCTKKAAKNGKNDTHCYEGFNKNIADLAHNLRQISS